MKRFALVICYESEGGPAFDHLIGAFDSEEQAYDSTLMQCLEDITIEKNSPGCLINNYVFEIK